MSVLDFPRIHFAGTCSLHEPTGNKNTEACIDFTRNQIYRNGELVRPEASVDEFYEHFGKLGTRYGQDGAEDPRGPFSSAAGRDYIGNSRVLWNARVTHCQTAFGSVAPDPLVGRHIDLWGHYNPYLGTTYNQPKVVELDSTSMWTRQIYAGQLSLGRTDNSARGEYLVNGYLRDLQAARFHKARHYCDLAPHWNADEIGRAELFQGVIERADIITLANAIESPVLAAFIEVLAQDASASGLVFQYVLFNASTPIIPNVPTFCSLVGTLGIWRGATEMRTFPSGRVCVPIRMTDKEQRWSRSRGAITLKHSAHGISVSCLPGLPFCSRSESPAGGPAHDPGRPAITDDLIVMSRRSSAPVARLPAAMLLDEKFLSHGGIVDLPYIDGAVQPQQLDDNDFIIAVHTPHGALVPIYLERAVVVEAESSTLYLDVPSASHGMYFDQTLEIRSFVRGAPRDVCGIELVTIPNPGFLAAGPKQHASDAQPLIHFSESGCAPSPSLHFSTDPTGHATITARGLRSGSARVLLIATAADREHVSRMAAMNPSARYDNDDQTGAYGSIGALHAKVLPDDWATFTSDETEISFSYFYEHVLLFYELLYPFMNKEIYSLADGPKCRAHALLSWNVCDPACRDKSYYMPPTRELSYPKAMLFKRYALQAATHGRLPPKIDRTRTDPC